MKNEIYFVGGCVRDKLLGIKSNDIDFTFVVNDLGLNLNPREGFLIMCEYLQKNDFKIFLSTPEMFTIRAKFPKNHKFEGLVADFVLARKEISYIKGTRIPILGLGNLKDDLSRRDFTVNAIAEDIDGNIIDFFNGLDDLRLKVLRTPLDTIKTINDDPLRLLRAVRFSITKDFTIEESLHDAILNFDYSLMKVVSVERIREELFKMFSFSTFKTLEKFNEYKNLMNYCFNEKNIWLKPTLEKV